MKTNFLIYFFLAVNLFAAQAHGKNRFPQKIVSLGPGITENLYILGAGNKIIADTIYCTRPAAAKKKPKIGSVIRANVEKIVSLKPDIVIATSLSNSRQIKKLKNLGIRVVSFSQPRNFSQICKQFLKLGKIVGEKEKAREIIAKAIRQVNSVREKTKNLPKPKVFVQIGARPLFTVTKKSFISDFIKFAGGINTAKNSKTGLYSREKVVESNPDIIIIVTMGVTGRREKEIWEKYKTLNAVKNDRIYIMDSYKICSPTPPGFVKTLKKMAELFHPEALRVNRGKKIK